MEDPTAFPILSLPKEVRDVIINKLPQRTAMKLRYVCRQFRDDIDNLYECNIKFDETNPHLSRMLKLRVKRVHIMNFLKLRPRTKIFEQPHLIQILDIQRPEISPVNFYGLLKEFGGQLTSLRITLSIPILRHEYKDPVLNFKNLLNLSISVDMNIKTQEEKTLKSQLCQDVNSFNKIVRESQKPKLKSLQATVGYESIEPLRAKRFSTSILAVVCRCWKSLENLEFSLMGWRKKGCEIDYLVEPAELEDSDLALFPNANNLANIVLESACTGMLMAMFEVLLKIQKNLKFLTIKLPCFEWDLFATIALNNLATLIGLKVTLTSVLFQKHQPLDMSIFKTCRRLEHLNISRIETNTAVSDHFVFNLADLPDTLKSLSIRCYRMLTNELLKLSSSGFGSLKSIFLSGSGSSGSFGVNGSILENLLLLPTLYSLAVMDFNSSDPEEHSKINWIYDIYKEERLCSCPLAQIIFSRKRDSLGWHPWYVMASTRCKCSLH